MNFDNEPKMKLDKIALMWIPLNCLEISFATESKVPELLKKDSSSPV